MITSKMDVGISLRKIGLIAVFSLLLVIGIAPFGAGISSSAVASQYNNVQVFIQTTQSTSGLSLYTLTAYNSTGSLISSSQSNYPAFSLELPSGTYLLSVTAVNESSQYYYYSGYSTVEYGWQLVQISSSTTLNMKTTPLQDISSSKISIHVKYVNGTSTSGAEVDASVVGLMYWWPFPSPYNSLTLWNQTDSSGSAILTVPSVPVIISAWDSVYVNLPNNQTTVVKNIGGELVNVTVYWQPMYVGLAGTTIIIPPATTGQITLHAEQAPYYWYGVGTPLIAPAYVEGTTTGAYSQATVSSSPGIMPSSAYNQQEQIQSSGNSGIPATGSSQGSELAAVQPSQIPGVIQETPQSPSALTTTDLVIAVSAIGALILAAGSFIVVMLPRKTSIGV